MTESDLTDHRPIGDWESKFNRKAWIIAGCELCYLLLLLAIVTASLLYLGFQLAQPASEATKFVRLPVADLQIPRQLVHWICVALSGVVGGIAFDLKWLYHSFAKSIWNVDRIFWRILVPVISGIVSVFLGFLIISGIIPFVKGESFHRIYFSLGFGFLFGYFSDHVLAAMYNTAQRWFGTTKESEPHTDLKE